MIDVDVVMLVELSMVEQRYDAVREVLDGATVTDVAIRLWDRQKDLHRWLMRYASEGLHALANHSSKPDRCPPTRWPRARVRIVELRHGPASCSRPCAGACASWLTRIS
jgi:leucine-zipper of insertion element IS481